MNDNRLNNKDAIDRCECRLSLRDYLHEKAEESRHNESQAYMLLIVGVILFSVGTLETILATDNPNWFLLIPYCITPNPLHLFGLFFTLSGLASVMSGGVLGVKYRLDRGQYLKELKELQSINRSSPKAQEKESTIC